MAADDGDGKLYRPLRLHEKVSLKCNTHTHTQAHVLPLIVLCSSCVPLSPGFRVSNSSAPCEISHGLLLLEEGSENVTDTGGKMGRASSLPFPKVVSQSRDWVGGVSVPTEACECF